MLKSVDVRDFIAGIVLVMFGLFVALYASSHYHVGAVERMGPGFFPMVLGWLLVGLGGLVAILSFRRTVHAFAPPPFAIRPFAAILLAVAGFALLIERIGLVVTTVIVIVVAAWANSGFRLRSALLLGAVLAALSWLVFVVALKMTIPVLPRQG